jgi:hypothetical protein
VKVLGFARSVSGRRRRGRRWVWLPIGLSAGLGGGASRTHSTAALLAFF